MFDRLWDYPILSPDASLHALPTGGMIFLGDSDEAADTRYVNPLMFRLLENCDGSHCVGEIANNASGDFGVEAVPQMVWATEEALRMQLITVASSAQAPISCRTTGSKDWFFPVHVSIELTDRCNLFCRHCYRSCSPALTNEIPTERLLQILETLVDSGVRGVELTGGEPLLHAGIEDIIDFCTREFGLVALITNGTLLGDELVERLAAVSHKVVSSVSLHGPTAEVHDQVTRVPGSFELALAGMRRLAEAGILVRANMCLLPENLAHLESTLCLAQEVGATRFAYAPAMPVGRGKDLAKGLDQSTVAESVARLLAEQSGLAERHRDFISLVSDDEVDEIESGGCGAGTRAVTLGPTGTLRPCLMAPESALALGNLLEQSFEEVFTENALVAALAETKVPSAGSCAGCGSESYCRLCVIRGLEKFTTEMGSRCAWAEGQALVRLVAGDSLPLTAAS